MLCSMTAFASVSGENERFRWTWDIKSVNGRGLELRLRLPEELSDLETTIRTKLKGQLARGNVTVALRLDHVGHGGTVALDADQVSALLSALDQIQDQAFQMGVTLGQPTAADVLSQRGVFSSSDRPGLDDGDRTSILSDFEDAIKQLINMRAAEGAAMGAVLLGQIEQIAGLVAKAEALTPERTAHQKDVVQTALQRVLDTTKDLDADRLEQELALIAIKSDVTEELDRLMAHLAAAKELLEQGKAVGRKLDFLSQEFNREANTLCSKSQFAPLTRIGLDLKAVIDQMREQIQNVE